MAGKPAQALNLPKIAADTKFFSGADLEQVVSDAIESAMERTFETGEIQPITNDDLKKAAKSRKATTLEWFSTAKNYATFSDVNRDYQIVLDYAKKHGIK